MTREPDQPDYGTPVWELDQLVEKYVQTATRKGSEFIQLLPVKQYAEWVGDYAMDEGEIEFLYERDWLVSRIISRLEKGTR